jgi:hypothetical protein
MKTTIVAILMFVLSATLFAGNPPEDAKSTPQFDKMKSLVGAWKAKDDDAKSVTASYKLVSDGSSLMESLEMQEHADAMITMYHLNGSKLMMTHYCSMGNQPRMRMEKASKDGNTFTFSFVDATNLASKKDSHMSKLVVTFKDDDHFTQGWTMSMDGKDAHHAVFEFERAK